MGPNSAYLAPFAPAPISGYDFGAKSPPGGWVGTGDLGWPVHLGTDFGTQAGQSIVASAPATVKFETGLPGYGNRLTETFDNGWSLIFGHVAGGATGRVAAGQPIGITGRNVGSAIGSVTLVELHNPSGRAVNPDAFIASLTGKQYGAASGSWGTPPPGLGPYGPNLPGGKPNAPAAGISPLDLTGAVAAIPTQVGHGLADFFATSEQNIAEWLKRQTVAFFVAAVVLLVLFG
jgi:hypothetical protein